MECTEDYFIKIPTKRTSFHAASFSTAAKSTLAVLLKEYTKFSTKVHSSFLYFMSVNLQGQAHSSRIIRSFFFNSIPLFNYGPKCDARSWEWNAKKREMWLFAWAQNLFEPHILAPAPLLPFSGRTFASYAQLTHVLNTKWILCFSHSLLLVRRWIQIPRRKRNTRNSMERIGTKLIRSEVLHAGKGRNIRNQGHERQFLAIRGVL